MHAWGVFFSPFCSTGPSGCNIVISRLLCTHSVITGLWAAAPGVYDHRNKTRWEWIIGLNFTTAGIHTEWTDEGSDQGQRRLYEMRLVTAQEVCHLQLWLSHYLREELTDPLMNTETIGKTAYTQCGCMILWRKKFQACQKWNILRDIPIKEQILWQYCATLLHLFFFYNCSDYFFFFQSFADRHWKFI